MARLIDGLDDLGAKTPRYRYDFGDGWERTIEIEPVFGAGPGVEDPRLIEALGRRPPEECGGPWRYPGFLEAIAAPKHERHAEPMARAGGAVDPNAVEAEARAE
jgi:hypothetical protein